MRVPVSLRVRLLLAAGVVALGALVIADVTVYAVLRSFLYNQVDTTLNTSRSGVSVTTNGPGAGGRNSSPPSAIAPSPTKANQPPFGTQSFCGRVAEGAPGMFVAIRKPSGSVTDEQICPAFGPGGSSYSPSLPSKLNETSLAKGSNNGPAVFLTAASTTTNGPTFRVRVARLENGDYLIIASPISSLLSTLRTLLSVEIAVTAAALLLSALVSWLLVRIGLRPLRDVEETAMVISSGEFTSRVPNPHPKSEVGQVASALNVMLERIEKAFGERDATESQLRASEGRLRRFVSDASHELRTPIAAISAYAQLFEQGAATEKAEIERLMANIADSTLRMARLVEDLLLLARLDENPPLHAERVELVGLLSDAIETALTVAPAWPIRFEASGPVEVAGDPIALRQVFDNLLANVRFHTPAGTHATVRAQSADSVAVVEISDDGPGLPAGEEERLFERFYRSDPSRSRDSGGSGLGLSIVASIVAAHDGVVEAVPHEGAGSLFRINLRALEPETDEE